MLNDRDATVCLCELACTTKEEKAKRRAEIEKKMKKDRKRKNQ